MFKQNNHLGSIAVNYKYTIDHTWFKHLQTLVQIQIPYSMEYFNLNEKVYNKTTGLACKWLK